MTLLVKGALSTTRSIIISGCIVLSLSAQAQLLPDSGRTLKELHTVPPVPVEPTQELIIEAPQMTRAAPGGSQVELQQVKLQGNTVFSTEVLLEQLGEVQGRHFDLEGLQSLAARITAFYRAHGYSFSLAYLPPQSLKSGQLVIGVVEGRYGNIELAADDELAPGLTSFLQPLQSGAMIDGQALSRTSRLLNTLPGVRSTFVLRPGQNTGEGDLTVDVTTEPRYHATLGFDNYGNRYTGEWRSHVDLKFNRVLMVGDELSISTMLTGEALWYGDIRYELPVGAAGWRLAAQYLQTYYELGDELESLGAKGKAKITKLGVRYPLLLKRNSQLNVAVDLIHSELNDRYSASLPTFAKSSNVLSLELNGHLFNSYHFGGVTQGRVALVGGELTLDSTLRDADVVTAQTDGGYHLLQLVLMHEQKLSRNFSLFAQLDTQWTNTNLDSSEGFGLGGAQALRAYPSGEAYGDRGWLGKLELRYQWRHLAPYLFYDTGEVTVNAKPWDNADNHRSLHGAGFGVRVNYKGVNVDASSAWRVDGGESLSDVKASSPILWLSVNYDLP